MLYNPLRNQIVRKLSQWNPTHKWTGEPLKDAFGLSNECRNLLPYLLVAYNVLQGRVALRNKEYLFVDAMRNAIPGIGKRMKAWLLQSPYCKLPPAYDPDGRATNNSPIQAGVLDVLGRVYTISLNLTFVNLIKSYPYWFRRQEYRVADLYTFCCLFGDPRIAISKKGNRKEGRYVFFGHPTNN